MPGGVRGKAAARRVLALLARCLTAESISQPPHRPPVPRLEVLDLASGVIKPITLLSKPPDTTIPGLAVSPDGRSLLVAQYDQNGSNIIMVERAP